MPPQSSPPLETSTYPSRKRGIAQVEHDDDDDDDDDASSSPREQSPEAEDLRQAGRVPGDNKLQQLVSKMVDDQRKRHKSRKSSINIRYQTSFSNIRDSLAKLFDDYSANAAQTHDTTLTHLQTLLQRKIALETGMAHRIAVLRTKYLAHAHDLQIVAEHRARLLG
ncbi:hypothetical protein CC78DRAFT_531737 [Lojkania enalia]|uniref:Uncharacterized protein n=1 Tax=Lojkania enalia TaxID=147567 RepID=A0A9P4KCU7_9PLEO|nr:hypothetical protein CC78DRAFT_531737 [Didymosphaeria enalia]